VPLQVWNENTIVDELIGSVEIDLPLINLAKAERIKYPLTPNGSIEATLALVTAEEAVCPRRQAMDGIGFLFVEVLSCEGLENTQYFGAQVPYAKATLLPERSSFAQTLPVEGGGTDPWWGWQLGSWLALKPSSGDTSVLIEVYNSSNSSVFGGATADELIGRVEIMLDADAVQLGQRRGYDLEEGGTLFCCFHRTPGYSEWAQVKQLAPSPPPDEMYKLLVVEVHKAEDIKDVGGFGSMFAIANSVQVYVRGGIGMPQDEKEGGGLAAIGLEDELVCDCSAVSQLCTSNASGRDPKWSGVSQNSLALRYSLEYGEMVLLLELVTSSVTGDELVGRVLVSPKWFSPLRSRAVGTSLFSFTFGLVLLLQVYLSGTDFGVGKRSWHNLDTGGRLECTIHTPLPPY
jgi:hypothetical protein